MAYSGAPSTVPNDAIRLLIWDVATSTASEILSDAEITYFRTAHGNTYMAAYHASLAIQSKIAAAGGSKSIGDLSIDSHSQFISYKDLSKSLYARAKMGASIKVTGISVTDKNTALDDPDRVGTLFSVGMHDDPANPQPGSLSNVGSTGGGN